MSCCISKKYFRPGRMAPSEWTHSARGFRDALVADYSAPGVTSTRRIPYHPLIAVLPFLLVLSVSYLNDHSGVVANCDFMSEWVHWVRACIGIAMQWVTLRKSRLAFHLPAHKMKFSLYQLYRIATRWVTLGISFLAFLLPARKMQFSLS
jgi:hypothetical protein